MMLDMTNEEAKQFLDELDDCGDDLDEWEARKDRENETFWGFELDPEKEKRLNVVKALCKKLHAMDKFILVQERELKNTTRHGHVAVSFPYLYIFNKRVASIMAQLFIASDTVVASVPALFAEDRDIEEDEIQDDELGRKGREVFYTFTVENMWKTYGKAPFGV